MQFARNLDRQQNFCKGQSHVIFDRSVILRTEFWRFFSSLLADVFTLQDEVTDNIVRAIAPTVRNAEIDRTRRKAPTNMDAYDHYLQALPHYYAMSREGTDEGLRLLDRSLALEPRFAIALALKAQMLAWRDVLGWTRPIASRHPEILRLARDSVQSDPNDPDILAGAAHLLAWAGGEYEEAEQLATRARATGANSAFVWMQVGLARFHSGHWQESVNCLEKALQLDRSILLHSRPDLASPNPLSR